MLSRVSRNGAKAHSGETKETEPTGNARRMPSRYSLNIGSTNWAGPKKIRTSAVPAYTRINCSSCDTIGDTSTVQDRGWKLR